MITEKLLENDLSAHSFHQLLMLIRWWWWWCWWGAALSLAICTLC